MTEITIDQIAKIMNTSPIRLDVSREEVVSFINTMKQYPLGTVTVDLFYLPLAVKLLENTSISTCAVISYPLGGLPTPLKLEQVKWAVENSVDEMEIPINFHALKSGDCETVKTEIEKILETAEDRIVRIVLMTAKLELQEIKLATKLCKEAGVSYIKTNGGYGFATTVDHIKYIREIGKDLKTMAAGGLRNAEITLTMLDAGADTIATTTPFDIFGTLKDAEAKLGEQKVKELAKKIEETIKNIPRRKKVIA